MGKGPPPPWSRRDCRYDHLVVAALSYGFEKYLYYSGIDTRERADDIRRGIYRCAKHRGISAQAVMEPDGRRWKVVYRLFDKRKARANHLRRYGTDRSKWPYDPRRPATAEERESWNQ